MACSGVEGIRTAAAASADDSVQFWKAHKHMQAHTMQERFRSVGARAACENLRMHAYTVM